MTHLEEYEQGHEKHRHPQIEGRLDDANRKLDQLMDQVKKLMEQVRALSEKKAA